MLSCVVFLVENNSEFSPAVAYMLANDAVPDIIIDRFHLLRAQPALYGSWLEGAFWLCALVKIPSILIEKTMYTVKSTDTSRSRSIIERNFGWAQPTGIHPKSLFGRCLKKWG